LEELGEVAGKLKRKIRGDDGDLDQALLKECGDVLWYASELATLHGLVLTTGSGTYSELKSKTDRLACSVVSLRSAMSAALDFCVQPSQATIRALLIHLNALVRMELNIEDESAVAAEHRLLFIAALNLEKLYRRYKDRTLVGSGDSR
jgi:hypothetical protein